MIRGVIFDFDGTLVDSNAIKYECFFEVARHLPNSDLHLTEILSDPKAGDRHDVFRHLAARYQDMAGSTVDAEALARRYTELCELRVSRAPEITGTRLLLETLNKAGLHLAISSATPQRTLQRIVAARGLSDHFADILGKPAEKTAHIDQIMMHLSVDVRGLVYVGDSEIDQQSALKKGCHFVGVGVATGRFETRPQYLVDDLMKIPPILEQICAV